MGSCMSKGFSWLTKKSLGLAALTYQNEDDAGGSVLLHTLYPVRQRLKGGPSGQIVRDHGAVSASVVTLCDGAETLLSRRVPDLHLISRTSHRSTQTPSQIHLCKISGVSSRQQ